MRLIPVFVVVLLICLAETGGHRSNVSHDKVDRKELLKDILWHYFWHKEDVRNAVGFLCIFSNHKDITANSPIKFDKVLRNDGHGYNGHTGIFTVPVTGLYHIYWSLLTYNSKNADINLMHNNTRLIRSWIHHVSVHDSASNMVYTKLKRGEKIFLQTSQSGLRLYGGEYSTFGGELIRY